MSNDPATEAITSWRTYTWPVLVALLLGGHVFVVTGALLLSSTLIPGASTAPAGYAEALAWDDLQAARRDSERIGWTLEILPSSAQTLEGERRIDFVLRDASGAPIDDADLSVTLYHHSRPNQPLEVRLSEGPYLATLPLRREGTWRIEAVAERGGDRFLVESDVWVARARRMPQ